MLSAKTCALYFLSRDPTGEVFARGAKEKDVALFNGTGRLRLGMYLHVAQMRYLAEFGELLFPDEMVSGRDCAIVPEIWERGMSLVEDLQNEDWWEALEDHPQERRFLEQFYDAWENVGVHALFHIVGFDLCWKWEIGTGKVLDFKPWARTYREMWGTRHLDPPAIHYAWDRRRTQVC